MTVQIGDAFLMPASGPGQSPGFGCVTGIVGDRALFMLQNQATGSAPCDVVAKLCEWLQAVAQEVPTEAREAA